MRYNASCIKRWGWLSSLPVLILQPCFDSSWRALWYCWNYTRRKFSVPPCPASIISLKSLLSSDLPPSWWLTDLIDPKAVLRWCQAKPKIVSHVGRWWDENRKLTCGRKKDIHLCKWKKTLNKYAGLVPFSGDRSHLPFWKVIGPSIHRDWLRPAFSYLYPQVKQQEDKYWVLVPIEGKGESGEGGDVNRALIWMF